MTEFSDWLHHLSPADVQALREFRRWARETYPDTNTPVSTALAGINVPPVIRAMPAHLVTRIEHELKDGK